MKPTAEILKCPYKSKPEENKEKTHLHYDKTVDSWAVGVMTYELLTGCPPFYDQSRTNTEARIKAGAPPAFPATLSEGARGFIVDALCKEPAQRPSMLDMLHHTWVEAFRARRSMRVLGSHSGGGADCGAEEAAVAPPAAAQAGGSPKKGGACSPATTLQQVEDMLGGVLHSAASSPCLGSQAAPLGPLAVPAATAALSRMAAPPLQAATGHGVQLSPPMPMEM
jgi:hypothetical protein